MPKEFDPHRMSRRQALKLGALSLGAVGLAACSGEADQKPTPSPSTTREATPSPSSKGRGEIYRRAEPTADNKIFISIDDGWFPKQIEAALETADRYKIPLTFFPVGEAVLYHPGAYEAVHERGHAIENHTLRHTIFTADSTQKEIEDEIKGQQEALFDTLGERVEQRFFRPPGGNGIDWDENGPIREPFPNLITASKKMGLDIATWDIDSRGVKKSSKDGSAEAIQFSLNNVVEELPSKGNGGFVLLHGIPADIGALSSIIEATQQRGLKPSSMRDIR